MRRTLAHGWLVARSTFFVVALALTFAPGNAYAQVCGDGTLDVGEDCDDGNTADGDCCASDCSFEGAATPCDDDDACTQTDQCDGAGACVGANPVVCTALDQCHNAGTCDPQTGDCSDPAKPDGTTCSDNDACTQTDTCQTGACTGANPVVCTALDQCHNAGTCDPQTGDCSDPAKPDGTTCSDNDACTQTDTCQTGACTGANPVVCTALDQCHNAGTCDPQTGDCSDPAKPDGTTCSDSNACTQTDTCQTGTCAGANPVVCTALDQCHNAGTCDPQTGDCSDPAKPDGTTCSDNDACTQTDTCQTGACTGANPVVCTALDQCHNPGTCDPQTGDCSDPAKPDGTTCSDNDACTQTDTCQTGTCTGANPVVCTALDQCHNPGTCDPQTGDCSDPAKPDGTTCSDNDACTQTDTCQTGACTGANPVVCTALDQCHNAGTCDPQTGDCSDPAKPDGTTCSDNDACTQTDTCQTGACTGANPVVCTALDQCHNAGTCDPQTGDCSDPAKPDGTTCSDNDACTQTDTCQTGTCTGANPVVCTALDQCHNAGTCDPQTGDCSDPAKPDGTTCSDNDACTQTDTCQTGACAGANPVVCTALDQCHNVGTCDPQTGDCSDPAKPDGTTCSDNDACTQTDTCQTGACAGANPVVCTALDQCHNVGTCDPQTGDCSDPAKPDGTTCSDNDACTQTDTCQTGACAGANPVVCTALDQCHNVGTCDPQTGDCSDPAKPDGTTCSDNNLCTQTDTCTSGACTGANPVQCTASDQCHNAGTCNPGTGLCSDPAKPDASSCDDGDACTQLDGCVSGACVGIDPVVCTASDQCHDAGTCDPQTGDCSNPAKTDGAVCDDANENTYDDACAAGTCEGTPISCGDGIVQSATSEACDAGEANGTDRCCSATCQVVDADSDGTCDRDDACPNDASDDTDDDTVCDDVDNCVGTANTGQEDMDGDAIGDACDEADATLNLALLKLRPGPRRVYTIATATGTIPTDEHPLSLTNGLGIRIQDGASLDETRQLTASECRGPNLLGRVTCRSDDRLVRVRLTPDRLAPNLYRFHVQVRRLSLASGYEGPARFTLSDMADRVGIAERCGGGLFTLTCRPNLSVRAE